MKALRDKLVADLTSRRALTDQVVRTLTDRCEIQSDQVGDFLRDGIGTVEEDVVDTVFSPMYTPDWFDRARYVPDRERLEIGAAVLSAIVVDLSADRLEATYPYEDGVVTMVLPEVIIDRWVQRLHLDVHLSDRVRQAIEATTVPDEHDMAKALAGAPDWRTPGREDLLVTFLTGFSRSGRFSLPKFDYLTGLIHTYRPRDLAHFRSQLDALVASYQAENGEPFFDAQLKETYDNTGRMARVQDAHGLDRKRQMSLASELVEDLAKMVPA